MGIMLLIIVLLYFMWSIAVLVFDADIWLRSKLRIEKPKVEPKESPPIPADDFIVRHIYTVSPKKVPSEPVQIKLKRSSCWPGGTEGQYEDRVVRLEDISMGINPTLDYSSVPSTMEVKAGAVTTN